MALDMRALQALGQRGKVVRVFDSGDLRVAMREGGTWTFNPECCTLLSEDVTAAAAAAASQGDVEESSSDEEYDDGVQVTRKSRPVSRCCGNVISALVSTLTQLIAV